MYLVFLNILALWLDWLKDEQKLIESENDRQKVNKLFLKAVEDYLCKSLYNIFNISFKPV